MDNSEKTERNKKFVLRFAAAMNALEVSEGAENIIRNFTDNEGYIKTLLTFRNAFPDYSIFIEDLTAEGDFVIIHGIFRGTHKGEIFGIPATFRKVEYQMLNKYHIVEDKIIGAWPMADQLDLFEQLGAVNRPV